MKSYLNLDNNTSFAHVLEQCEKYQQHLEYEEKLNAHDDLSIDSDIMCVEIDKVLDDIQSDILMYPVKIGADDN